MLLRAQGSKRVSIYEQTASCLGRWVLRWQVEDAILQFFACYVPMDFDVRRDGIRGPRTHYL